jgi:transposase
MSDVKLSDEQWEVIAPLLPPQSKTGRRRAHDRQVLNSLVYRLKMGVRYKDIPRSEDYAAKSTVYHWLKRWSEEGVLEGIWQRLMSLLERGSIALLEAAGELESHSCSRLPTPTNLSLPEMCSPTSKFLGLVGVDPKRAFLRWQWTKPLMLSHCAAICASVASRPPSLSAGSAVREGSAVRDRSSMT